MSRIIIEDDTGETYESGQFIAVILQEGSQVLGLSEIGQLTPEEQLAFLVQGVKLNGELANFLNPDQGDQAAAEKEAPGE